MLNSSPAAGTVRTAMLLVVALAGCAQVFDIEDWTNGSSSTGGAGGTGQGSASAGTGGQSSASAAVGTGGQTSTSTQSAGVGTGGQTSTSTQSASVGTGGQGGSPTGLEVCTNGADDDNDGHVDCADTDCVSYWCMPPVPSDWQGWVKVYKGFAGQPPPACGDGWTSEKNWLAGTLSASDATCSCACQGPTGGNCFIYLGDDHLNLYNDMNCTAALAQVTPISTDTCYLLSTASITRKSVSFQANTPAMGGTCTTIGGVVNKPPATFDQLGLTCESPLTGAGCNNATDVCVAKPAAPFIDALCIYKQVPDPVNVSCPAGTTKLGTFYGGIMDERDCAPCSCGQPGSQFCPMTAQIFLDSICSNSGLLVTLSGDGMCKATGLQSAATYYKISVGAPTGSACPASPPMPTGEAYGTDPVVVCCM